MANKDGHPCERCHPRIMEEHGCCTNDVGFGTKLVIHGGVYYEVCKKLKRDGDGCYCSDYYNRPMACRSFECIELLRYTSNPRRK